MLNGFETMTGKGYYRSLNAKKQLKITINYATNMSSLFLLNLSLIYYDYFDLKKQHQMLVVFTCMKYTCTY